ncbi:MAG: hypothetical protein HY301_06095 [Verrucomicrobia bacterium]|nr:hypothetical protein [Verrucomicrobiota bacterium]
MKSLAVGLVGSLVLGTLNSRANLEVSGSVEIHATTEFHALLAPHGAWIEVDSFGRCWQPGNVTVEWRPYCVGHWVWTDCGWYWASDEPWAWACYHYGWWYYHPVHHWVWVPGIEWAPAWVTWRSGGGFVGWAPLPPRGITLSVRISGGVPSPFVFVEAHRFHERLQPASVIVNNTTVINKTTVIKGNLRHDTRTFGDAAPQKVVVNEGLKLADLQEATEKRIPSMKIHEAISQTAFPREARHAPAGTDRLSPEHKVPPGAPPETPEGRPGKRDEVVPAPGQPPGVEPGDKGRRDEPPRGHGKGKGPRSEQF